LELYLSTIFRAIGYNKSDPILSLVDNQLCIDYSKNDKAHRRTKRIEIFQHGNIALAKVPTKKKVSVITYPILTSCLSMVHMPMWNPKRSSLESVICPMIYQKYFIKRECLIYVRDGLHFDLLMRLSLYMFPENYMELQHNVLLRQCGSDFP